MTGVVGYRQAIEHFATGVVIVTAVHDGRRYAMTANALTSVSLDPILILVCFARDSDTGKAVRESGRFGLSVLDVAHGEETVRRWSRKLGPGEDQLEGAPLVVDPDGLPFVEGALAHLACRVERVLQGGDHDVVVGEVVRFTEGADDRAEPMLFYQGRLWGIRAG